MKTVNFPFDFELDPYEQALEKELEYLDQAGLLVVRKLTSEEKKIYQKAATNTLQLLREGKRSAVERPGESDSSKELLNWLSPVSQRAFQKPLKKQNASLLKKALAAV